MKVDYDRETFITLSDVGKKLAIKYCDEHPKERYDCSDFEALYHTKKPIEFSGGEKGSSLWDEHNSNFDRIINTFCDNEWGK